MNFGMLRHMRRIMFSAPGRDGRSEVAETSSRSIRRLAVSLALLMSLPLAAMTVEDDDAVWGSVDCGSEELVELYLREFPEGRHAAEARACLARIEEKKDRKDRKNRVEGILDECRAHYESNRLTRGSVGNALDCYREVLSLDRGNAEALSGIRRIERYFVEKAESALEESRPDDALSRIERLEMINPEHSRLEELKRRAGDLKERLAAVQDGRTAGAIFRDCDACPEMVVVPAGTFMMGSHGSEEGRRDDEGPEHRVTISQPFAVGKYEVTRGDFKEYLSDIGHSSGRGCDYWTGEEWTESDAYSWRSPGFAQGEDDPVVCVSWEDAKSYVKWLSGKTGEQYRLLSESEWEYAARAGTSTPFHFGSTISTDEANYDGNYVYGRGRTGVYRGQTVPVGSFPANDFGLHEVHGNVWEWVEDCWNGSYDGAPSDGSAWTTGGACDYRVLRGGSWNFKPRNLRSANRDWFETWFRSNGLGFRVARTLAP